MNKNIYEINYQFNSRFHHKNMTNKNNLHEVGNSFFSIIKIINIVGMCMEIVIVLDYFLLKNIKKLLYIANFFIKYKKTVSSLINKPHAKSHIKSSKSAFEHQN